MKILLIIKTNGQLKQNPTVIVIMCGFDRRVDYTHKHTYAFTFLLYRRILTKFVLKYKLKLLDI